MWMIASFGQRKFRADPRFKVTAVAVLMFAGVFAGALFSGPLQGTRFVRVLSSCFSLLLM